MLSRSLTTNKYFWHGVEITETEFNHIKSIIDNRPVAPNGYMYYLTLDLQWKLYEVSLVKEDDILS